MKSKMKNSIIILTLITSIVSCQNEINAKFEITNKTYNTLDSINIKSFDHKLNTNFLNLEQGETQIYFLDMTELPKVDGDYLLTFKENPTNTKLKRFGYFTNGYPSEEVTKIEIRKDTVIIEQQFDEY